MHVAPPLLPHSPVKESTYQHGVDLLSADLQSTTLASPISGLSSALTSSLPAMSSISSEPVSDSGNVSESESVPKKRGRRRQE